MMAPAVPKASAAILRSMHEQLPRHEAATVKRTKEPEDWAAAAATLVEEVVQRLLGRPLRLDEPFMSAGLDSLGAAHLTPFFHSQGSIMLTEYSPGLQCKAYLTHVTFAGP